MAAPRDYLSHLPWKALKIVISNLPDLPSIFRLFEASENAKNIILSHVPNLAQLIENNINRPIAEGGLHPENKILLRLFALISWRQMSGPQRRNPLPVNYHDVIPALANTFSMAALSFSSIENPFSTIRECFASLPLHNSIPPIVIYQILSLSSLAQQVSHGCFHDCVARCLALPLRQLKPDERPPMDFSLDTRPKGNPLIPVDLGPPTYWEEQRLLQTALRFFLFWDLKDAVVNGTFNMDRPDDGLIFKLDDIEGYWCKPFQHVPAVLSQRGRMMWSEIYQMGAFIAWAKSCNPGVPLSKDCLPSLLRNSPASMPCCPLTPAAPNGFVSGDMAMINGIAPGWSILANLKGSLSGFADSDTEFFMQFGFDFWDHERLQAFGLTHGPIGRNHALDSYRPNTWRHLFRLAFVWSSILPDPRWRIDARDFFEVWPN
jgi:hypothetical protein